MLPSYVRFQIENATGVALAAGDAIKLTGRFVQLLISSGALSYTAVSTIFNGTTDGNSLASGGVLNSAAIDVSNLGGGGVGTTLGAQFDGVLTVGITTATPNGNINLRLQESTDGGTTWPDDKTGMPVGSINFTATGTKKINVAA